MGRLREGGEKSERERERERETDRDRERETERGRKGEGEEREREQASELELSNYTGCNITANFMSLECAATCVTAQQACIRRILVSGQLCLVLGRLCAIRTQSWLWVFLAMLATPPDRGQKTENLQA